MNKDNHIQIAPNAQKNVVIDVAQQVGNKQPPSNAQISELMENTQNFLDQKKSDPSVPPETMKTLSDFKDVLSAADQLNQNKNQDESVQKIIVESAQATKDMGAKGKEMKNDPSLQGTTNQMGTQAKQLSQSVFQILKMMVTSGEFRTQINSLIGLFQEMFLSEDQSSQKFKPPSEEKKKEMAGHFLSIMRRLNENNEFKSGLNNLIDMFRELQNQSAPHSQMKEAVSSNQHIDAVSSESKKLIEKFSDRPIDPFIAKTKEFFEFIRRDERTRSWFDRFVGLLSDSVKNPHDIDESEFTNRVRDLINDAHQLTNEDEFRTRYSDVGGELRAIASSIKDDEDLKNLQFQTQKFLDNFSTVDAEGNRKFNGDLVQQMRTFIVPLLIAQLDNIPIPPIEGSNESMDYFFENMVLSGHDIIPDKINLHSRGDHSIDLKNLSPHQGTSALFLDIHDIKPVMNDIHFKFTRKTFPKISDDGIANVQITKNQGISIRIALSLRKGSTSMGANQTSNDLVRFNVDRVDVDVSKVDIQIVHAKHDFLLKLFTSVYQTRIRTMLEQKISERITEALEKIEAGLNNLMEKHPPSQLKEVVTQGASKLGEKVSDVKSSLAGSSTEQSTQQAIQS